MNKPQKLIHIRGLKAADGCLDNIAREGNLLLIEGWMVFPQRSLDSFTVYLDGQYVGSTPAKIREDVAAAFPHILHARQCAFSLRVQKPVEVGEAALTGRLDIVGYSANRPIAQFGTEISTWFRVHKTDLVAIPAPLPDLMRRVAGFDDPTAFKKSGLSLFQDFLNAIGRHVPVTSFRHMLDWGCGCGRSTVHFLTLPDGPEVFGCDIDAEAVEWCNRHLKEGAFRVISIAPPMPYEDGRFDLAVGYSVFTHLTREMQNVWLAEMHRVIAPGGFFLASTHGEVAASMRLTPKERFRMAWLGIYDERQDEALSGIAPAGYYRGTFQTRRYTLREWGKYFEIVDYIERGLGNFQDLVVMRRPE